MLRRFAHAVVSIPAVYDRVQALAGQGKIAGRVREAIASLPGGRTLDVGSAGGRLADRLGVAPVFADIDLAPLAARRRREGPARLVGGDAAYLPFRDQCFDLSLCLFVSHHLDDEELRRALRGLARVTSGALVFADALRNDRRAVSRWLWNYDRGRHPRTEETITGLLRESFNLSEVARFSVYHQYMICVGRPRSSP